MRRVVLAVLIVALLMSCGCAMFPAARARRYVSRVKDKQAPELQLTTLDGQTARLDDYRGKPVLLAFWAYG